VPTGADLLAEQPAEVQTAMKEHHDRDGWPTYTTPGYVLYPYNFGADPLIDCEPLPTTDIQLHPDETITDVAMGDTERWMATPASSGDRYEPLMTAPMSTSRCRKASEAPALLIATGSGNQMVNYRVRGDYYVFDQAVMVAGVGRHQDRVTIQYAGNPR
jgi:type IV secretory pathway VirB9-like protein